MTWGAGVHTLEVVHDGGTVMGTRTTGVVVGAAAVVALIAGAALGATADIGGEVGATSDPAAAAPGLSLRHVGADPGHGFSHTYQWASPRIRTASPEVAPVTFTGTIDTTDSVVGDVAFIGLYDAAALEAGDDGYQSGAMIYVFRSSIDTVDVAVTDGNAGGEIVQGRAKIGVGSFGYSFSVDGTADPSSCAVPAGSGVGGDGCMTLTIQHGGGTAALSDSYGSITSPSTGAVELAAGGVPGWDAFDGGPTGIDFTATVAFADPANAGACRSQPGFAAYGFANQGKCIGFVRNGTDARIG